MVCKAEALELDRVLISLPPVGFGGVVDILDVCEGEVRRQLADPLGCLLPEKELPRVWPQPQVRVKGSEWEPLAVTLFERGILAPTEEVLVVDNRKVLNGLFGVEKSSKVLPDGRTSQRLIMDLRASNSMLRPIGGDIASLTGAAAFTAISLAENQTITISGDDLVSSFYLFKLPKEWLPFLAFGSPISWRALGFDRDGITYMAACVLPMGFASSVGVMQHIHRRMALWGPLRGAGLSAHLEVRRDREWPLLEEGAPAWALYLDDSTFLKKVQTKMNEELSGLAPDDQERMRRVYQYYGIPYNLEKALEEVSQAERLGAYLDGERGRIGVTVKRLLENITLGVFVLGQGQVTRKSLQVLAGKEVHCLQFRRPLFSVHDRLWTLSRRGG